MIPEGSPPAASVISVEPEPLQHPELATYVMPDGKTSVMIRLVAAAVPAFEYDKVTVIAADDGDAPLFTLNAFVTFKTDD